MIYEGRSARTSRTTIGEIRSLVRDEFQLLAEQDCWGGSHPDETYDQLLIDDPVYDEHSAYVPADIKSAIRKWMHAMGLDGRKRLR